MKASDAREKTLEELDKEKINLLQDQFKLRIQASTGQLKQTHLLKQTRRDIARLNMVIREKQRQQQQGKSL